MASASVSPSVSPSLSPSLMWTDDILSGGTATADVSYAGNVPSKACDDNSTTKWLALSLPPHWWQYDFGSGVTKTVRRLRIQAEPEYDRSPSSFTFEASNTGAFSGEETTLLTVTDEPWTSDGEWKTWTFSNASAYRYYRIDITEVDVGAIYTAIAEVEMMESLGSPSISPSKSPSLSPSASLSPSISESSSPSISPSGSPSLSPSASISPSESPSESYSSSQSPSSSPSSSPSKSPSSSPSLSPSASISPSRSPSLSPSVSESKSPSMSPSKSYSSSPSQSVSSSPSKSPSRSPSPSPSLSPSKSPSKSPSRSPSMSKSMSPSRSPSLSVSGSPSKSYSVSPSVSPSKSPSLSPSASPSASPSEAPASTVVIAMNTSNFTISTYTNYDFNSFAEIGRETYYGATSSGIYKLGGPNDSYDDDDGTQISCEIKKEKIDLGAMNEKRISETYINLESSGDLTLKITADSKSQMYLLSNGFPGLHTLQFMPGKGLVGKFLDFSLKNHNGADMKINEIEMLIDVLSRRAHND